MAIVHIDGWTCAVKTGKFSVGDLVLFFEIDCFLPASDPRFMPLSNFSTWNGTKGFHVKSIMMGKEISQGLVYPIKEFPEVTNVLDAVKKTEGGDVAVEKIMKMSFEAPLKVQKWELSATESTRSLGAPPAFIPKTDIERVQNCGNLYTAEYKNVVFQESTKMDGMAMTVYFVRRDSQWYKSVPPLPAGSKSDMPQGRIGVCSRKHDLPESSAEGRWWEVALANGLPKKLANINRNVAVQGELCGESIARNREGFAKGQHEFYVYRMFDIDAQSFVPPKVTEERAGLLGLRHVPVQGYFKLHEIAKNQEGLLKRAVGTGVHGKNREGLVYKNCTDGRCFKVISNTYLVENGE
ncbi:Uu.00g060710.m01.CDS01 [Anthostomella pinea]|uniref:Uu.00g060710.m01.CDS01 n=1 Tax=Anthostomella pinea TaxID=933095 RepID=A0AAI8YK28_9PEZI|nr:Uu.00g060710.m01.CDS01 [Anthostomella pinea]